MLKQERQELILREINVHNKVLSSDLSSKLKVSEDTIRRDLNELAEADKIVKVHGGALSKSYHLSSYPALQVYSYQKKAIIAQKALSLLKEGMFIMVSGGTTCREFVRIWPEDLQATVFTNSLSTAMQLMEHPHAEVILLGGRLSKNAQLTVAGEVIRQLDEIRMDICFTGLNGLDTEKGLTDNDWEVVQMTRAMLKASDQVVALTISEKLNSVQRMRVAGLHELDYLITELEPDDEQLSPFKKHGLKVL